MSGSKGNILGIQFREWSQWAKWKNVSFDVKNQNQKNNIDQIFSALKFISETELLVHSNHIGVNIFNS